MEYPKPTSPKTPMLAREESVNETLSVFERMFRAVELVKERLERACGSLSAANVPYAVIGGNAVAAWVATIDDGAVRNTRDVDLLLREEDLERATEALASVGFVRDRVMNVIVFLDGPEGKPSQGIHILLADRKVRDDYASFTPSVDQAIDMDGKKIVSLQALVEMKLNSFRRKDQTHLVDMIQLGLIDQSWPSRFPKQLGDRLQSCSTTQKTRTSKLRTSNNSR
ncbi:MAG: hypothetical protein U0930_13175 [Pirellulales bacterium]